MNAPSSARDDLDLWETHELRSALLDLAEGLRRCDSDEPAWRDHVELLERLLGADICRRLGIYQIPDDFVLSVVIPAYNERPTIQKLLDRVRDTRLPLEMIVVDDGSRDGTRELLAELQDEYRLTLLLHEKNQGKGAAVRTGLMAATGDAVVIQDADLEYDPRDYRLLLLPILEDRADIVYGSRFLSGDRSISPLWHQRGNQFLTCLSNLRTGLSLTDVETCYKVFRREFIQRIAPTLQERGFGIELEITAKLSRLPGIRFHERPISYARRSYAEGKKIGMKDAFWALWCIARY